MWNLKVKENEIENLTDCILDGHVERVLPDDVTEGDLKYYIEYVNRKQVSLSDGASALLKNYFVGTRRARGE